MSGFFESKKDEKSVDFIGREVRLGDIIATNRPGTSYRDIIPALVVGFTPKKVRLAMVEKIQGETHHFKHLVDQSKPPEGSRYYQWEVFTKFPEELALAIKKEDVVLYDATTGDMIV
jgi:hypothetical protein